MASTDPYLPILCCLTPRDFFFMMDETHFCCSFRSSLDCLGRFLFLALGQKSTVSRLQHLPSVSPGMDAECNCWTVLLLPRKHHSVVEEITGRSREFSRGTREGRPAGGSLGGWGRRERVQQGREANGGGGCKQLPAADVVRSPCHPMLLRVFLRTGAPAPY